jgi:hypothetical protein
MKKTNFDRYLEKQMEDPAFAARFERAGEAWDVALQIAPCAPHRTAPEPNGHEPETEKSVPACLALGCAAGTGAIIRAARR